MRIPYLGEILQDSINKIEQAIQYFDTIKQISNKNISGTFEIHDSDFTYSIVIAGDLSKIIVGYQNITNCKNFNKISDVKIQYLQICDCNEPTLYQVSENIKNELEIAIKENVGLIKDEKIEIHSTLAEFIQKFISHYENQLFAAIPKN